MRAKEPRSQGARVVCADIDREAASETADLISHIIGAAHPIATDVSNHKSSISMVVDTAEEFGRVDILYANAGIHLSGSVTNTLLKDWQRVMSVNLTGVWLSNQAVIPQMLEQG